MENSKQYQKALFKLISYCEYQERCVKQIVDKIARLELPQSQKQEIKNFLTENKYVDDERFAQMFVLSKINKGWGRIKIKYALRGNKINSDIIQSAIAEIDEEQYINNLKDLIKQKQRRLKSGLNFYERKQKIALFLQSKGYESDVIFSELNNLNSEDEQRWFKRI